MGPVKSGPLIQYFDRAYIIHLPERHDRFRALRRELRWIGVDINDDKVRVPDAPRPSDANGFASRGVYGSYLSHLGILQEALREGLKTVWVLEDDAVFKRRLCFHREQSRIVETLSTSIWDLCYLGHSLRQELRGMPAGLVAYSGPFMWAHCYAVHTRILPRLVAYLEQVIIRQPGHSEGGRMYIDGAYTLFRRLNPDVVSLVSNPCLSAQKGSPSGLAHGHWYDRYRVLRPFLSVARKAKGECWKRW